MTAMNNTMAIIESIIQTRDVWFLKYNTRGNESMIARYIMIVVMF